MKHVIIFFLIVLTEVWACRSSAKVEKRLSPKAVAGDTIIFDDEVLDKLVKDNMNDTARTKVTGKADPNTSKVKIETTTSKVSTTSIKTADKINHNKTTVGETTTTGKPKFRLADRNFISVDGESCATGLSSVGKCCLSDADYDAYYAECLEM
jgi:hypothetical protein